MSYRIKDVIFSAGQVQAKVRELAGRISADYRGKNPIVTGILKGAWLFHADLVRALDVPCEIDFIKISSYGKGTTPSGTLRFDLDFSLPLEGRHVLLVEDIVDTGLTLHTLLAGLASRGPADVRVCALLDKAERRKVSVPIDYLGFPIPDVFVVGYGLDCAEQYRGLDHIASVEEA
jgi:hypoxanthine phosphoribosyltransferase